MVDGGQFVPTFDGGPLTETPTEPTYAGYLADWAFALSSEDADQIVPQYSLAYTLGDRRWRYTGTDVVLENKIITATQTRFRRWEPITWSSSNTAIATVDRFGRVYHQGGAASGNHGGIATGDGTVVITAASDSWTETISLSLAKTGITESLDALAGSAREEATDAVDDRIALRNETAIYSTKNHTTSTYVRNANYWATDIDLTCASPWNSNLANKKGGVLVSPRHILFAKHYKIVNGSTIRFVTMDNVVVERTLSSQQDTAGDITVGLLDSDVPGAITFAKVLPTDYADYFPEPNATNKSGKYIPVIRIDQEAKALVGEVSVMVSSSLFWWYTTLLVSARQAFSETIVDGDSGQPVFMIIDGAPVLLATVQHAMGYGPAVVSYHDAINSIMTSLGGGYQLTDVDLTGFTDFS